MNNWLKGIVGYSLLVSAAMQLLPDKKYEPYVRIFMGTVLLAILVGPLLSGELRERDMETQMNRFLQKANVTFETEELDIQIPEEPVGMIEIEPVERVEVSIGENESEKRAGTDPGTLWDSSVGDSHSHSPEED